MSSTVETLRARPWVLVAACLAAVLLPTSITGTGVALPAISQDLPGGIGPLQWVVHAYDLTFASFMLAMGCLSDIFGRRRVFVIGTGAYALCALVASLSQSLLVLDVVRAVTGIAAAAVMTSAAAALAQTYSGPAQARAFGLFGTSFGVGLAFGPIIAGGLTSAFGWRYFFGVQVVIALLALLAARGMPTAVSGQRPRIDWAGTGTFVGSLFAFILALVEGPQLGWTHPAVLAMLVASIAGVVAFAVVESRQDQPMFDLRLLQERRYLAVCAAPVALAFGFVTLLVFLPTYFMTAFDMSAWQAGLSMLFLTVGTLVMPAVAGTLVAKGASARVLLMVCMGLVAIGCFWLTVMTPQSSVAELAGPLLTIGIGFGISNGILDGAAATAVPPARAGMAVGMFNTTRIAGEVIAIAVVGSMIVGLLRTTLPSFVPGYAGSTGSLANSIAEGGLQSTAAQVDVAVVGEFLSTSLDAYTSALHVVFVVIGIVCLVMVPVIAVLMRPEAGARSTVEVSEPVAENLHA